MKIQKRIAALLSALSLLLVMGVAPLAIEAPDLSKTGSISVSMSYRGRAVPGGRLALYRVGAISEKGRNYSFVLTEEFAGSGADLSDIYSAKLAQALADYAKAQKLTGTSVTIESDGKAKLSDLTLGLYLIVQTRAASGYEPVSPFLVSVPMNENGAYIYAADATPKMETLTKTPDEPKPTPDTPWPTPNTPSVPDILTLPQTGQLNWPVPVLAALGLCLFLFGWALRYDAKRERHET